MLPLLLVLTINVKAAHELPDVKPGLIDDAIDAALNMQTREVSAALIVALCWAESRCDPHVITGTHCGVLQVDPKDLGAPASLCEVWTSSTLAGIAAGVVELEMLLGDSRVHHDLRLALQYRACGNAVFDWTCSEAKLRWVDRALKLAERLSRVVPTS